MSNRTNNWLKGTIIFVVGVVAAKAFEGIIGNEADNILRAFMEYIRQSVQRDFWSWGITITTLVLCSFVVVYGWHRLTVSERAFLTDHKMLALDASLLRELAIWTPSADHEKEMKRIVTDSLRDATIEFDGQVSRAALLLPNGEELSPWASYQMPQESLESMHFYIGPDKEKQKSKGGIAGEVYHNGILRIGHMSQNNGRWICEEYEHYVKYSGIRPYPAYLSFVCVPIIGIDPDEQGIETTRLGVVCFDSMNKHIFDTADSETVLRTFALRIAAVLLISKLYKQIPLPSATSV